MYALYHSEGAVYSSRKTLFRPSTLYPEYPFACDAISPEKNIVYESVRDLFHIADLDSSHFGSAEWNPLGEYVKPGDRVLIKPNLVMDRNLGGYGEDCLFTNPSVIAAVIDYVVIALRGTGRIVLADAPMQSCDLGKLAEESGIVDLLDFYSSAGVIIEFKDLRELKSVSENGRLYQTVTELDSGVVVDMGKDSSFFGLSDSHLSRLRITNYDPSELRKHHTADKHEYRISRELLEADVVINMPKMKTHRKAGVTGALKNLVGVNTRKEYLPHHSVGSSDEGFDEYSKRSKFKSLSAFFLDKKNMYLGSTESHLTSIYRFLSLVLGSLGRRISEDNYSEGSWFGNDTIWRMVLDINKVALYADKEGVLKDQPQRKMIVVSDMVVAGEGEGPLLPEPVEIGCVAFSDSSIEHDVAMARLAGSSPEVFPTIFHSMRDSSGMRLPYQVNTVCRSNSVLFDGCALEELNDDRFFSMKPADGWKPVFQTGFSRKEEQ